jgi:hypothetical protein
MDLPVFENVTRPIRAGPFSDADFILDMHDPRFLH